MEHLCQCMIPMSSRDVPSTHESLQSSAPIVAVSRDALRLTSSSRHPSIHRFQASELFRFCTPDTCFDCCTESCSHGAQIVHCSFLIHGTRRCAGPHHALSSGRYDINLTNSLNEARRWWSAAGRSPKTLPWRRLQPLRPGPVENC